MSNKQLAQEQRYQIYALKKAGVKDTEIANILQVHKSIVCREIKRNTGGRGYRPKQAHALAESRKRNSIQKRITHVQWLLVEGLLEEDSSPEQISCWLKMNTGVHLSHEWIYHYIRADKQWVVPCIHTYAAGRNSERNMAPVLLMVKSLTGSV